MKAAFTSRFSPGVCIALAMLLLGAACPSVDCKKTPSDPQCKVATTSCSDSECAAKFADKPFCDTSIGACVVCRGDADCTSSSTGKHCNPERTACVGCRNHNDCAAVGEYCEAATSQCVKGCTAEAPRCGTTQVCDTVGKVCVACLVSGDCSASQVCDPKSKTCVACNLDTDCGAPSSGKVCRQNACVCTTAPNSCGANKVCYLATNACVQCLQAADCAGVSGKPFCDTATKTCAACPTCSGSTPACDAAANACVQCLGNGDCTGVTAKTFCDTGSKTCVACLPSADNCPANQYCGSSFSCVAGCKTPEPTPRECATELVCSTHACVPGCAGTGQSTCATGQTCQSGVCFEADWHQRSPSTSPAARLGVASAFDTDRNVLVMVGGWIPALSSRGADTWEFDGSTWRQVALTGLPTNGIMYAGMVYDSLHKKMVLFGGDVSPSVPAQETYEWTYGQTAWAKKNLTSSQKPLARAYPAMAFDSGRGKTVLYGGDQYTASRFFSDLWEYDGTAWTQIALTGATPPGLAGAGLAYDPVRAVTILFGGANSSNHNETWQWNGSNWLQRNPSNPPPTRAEPLLVWDSHRQVLVLFGGNSYPSSTLSDTWEWNGSGWNPITTVASPASRWGAAGGYFPTLGRVVVFGGSLDAAATTADAQTWVYGGP